MMRIKEQECNKTLNDLQILYNNLQNKYDSDIKEKNEEITEKDNNIVKIKQKLLQERIKDKVLLIESLEIQNKEISSVIKLNRNILKKKKV